MCACVCLFVCFFDRERLMGENIIHIHVKIDSFFSLSLKITNTFEVCYVVVFEYNFDSNSNDLVLISFVVRRRDLLFDVVQLDILRM